MRLDEHCTNFDACGGHYIKVNITRQADLDLVNSFLGYDVIGPLGNFIPWRDLHKITSLAPKETIARDIFEISNMQHF